MLRSREHGQGPRIARLPNVRIIERAELDADAFTAAQVQSARSLALLRQDDLGNFHAALRAQEINPDLRLVVAIFNTSLSERIRTFFRDCAVLSGSRGAWRQAEGARRPPRIWSWCCPEVQTISNPAKLGLPNRSLGRYPQGRSSPVVLQGHL